MKVIGLLILIVAFFLSASGNAHAQATSDTVIILDSTAQMGAKLGVQRKIDLVKSVVPEALGKLNGNHRVSIWAFGTQPAKKCEDSAQLVATKRVSEASRSTGETLTPLEPKAGRAPVFATVRSALKSTPDAETKAVSLVIVTGAGDDCGGDICASARALNAIYPKAKLSVISLGLGKPASDVYACAAKAMGGSFFQPKSGPEIDRALRQAFGASNTEPLLKAEKPAINPKTAAAKLPPSQSTSQPAQASLNEKEKPGSTANTESKVPGPTPAPEPEVAISPPPAQVVEPNVIVTATLAQGLPPLDAGVTWRISRIVPAPNGQDRVAEVAAWIGAGGPARAKLADGRYQVDVTYGLSSAKSDLVVTAGKVEKTLSLEAGTIAAQGVQTPKGQPAEGVLYTLYRKSPNAAPLEVARSSAEPALFHVNAGEYMLSAVTGQAKIETPVTVIAGKVSAVNMALNVGLLEVKTFAVDGSPKLIPAWHRLFPSNAQSSTPYLTLAGPTHRIQLPAGTYRLETYYEQTRETNTVTVNAGQIASQSVVLNAGEAKIQTNVQAGAQSPNLVCSIFEDRSDHAKGPLGRASGREPLFVVKAGVYDVECRKGTSPVIKQARVQVVAGQTQTTLLTE